MKESDTLSGEGSKSQERRKVTEHKEFERKGNIKVLCRRRRKKNIKHSSKAARQDDRLMLIEHVLQGGGDYTVYTADCDSSVSFFLAGIGWTINTWLSAWLVQ